jgi:hypothetical protein
MAAAPSSPQTVTVREILPKNGLVFSEKGNPTELLCKPIIMPIKSSALERLEQLEKEAKEVLSGPAPIAMQQASAGNTSQFVRPQSATAVRPGSARRNLSGPA